MGELIKNWKFGFSLLLLLILTFFPQIYLIPDLEFWLGIIFIVGLFGFLYEITKFFDRVKNNKNK